MAQEPVVFLVEEVKDDPPVYRADIWGDDHLAGPAVPALALILGLASACLAIGYIVATELI